MSTGKDIRANMEEALEEAFRDYLDCKAAGNGDTKTKRGIVRGLSIAVSIQRDPEDWDNAGAHRVIEKEFLARVSD